MAIKQRRYSIELLYGWILTALFAVLSLFLVLIGKDVYTQIVNRMENNHDLRVATSYIANKVRAGDCNEGISVWQSENTSVLSIRELGADDEYQICIYYYKGMLKEQLLATEEKFTPEKGEDLVPINGFTCTMKDNIVNFKVVDKDDKEVSMQVRFNSYNND